jgi:hypothetical protein
VMIAPARSLVSSSPPAVAPVGSRTCLWGVRDTKTLFGGRTKITSENDEIKKKPGKDNRKLPK